MLTPAEVLVLVNLIILSIAVILSLLYLFMIILNSRFHTSINILTGNYCLCGAICAVFWLINGSLSTFGDPLIFHFGRGCIFFLTCSTMVNGLLIYALVMISINRYIILLYPNQQMIKRIPCSIFFCIGQWIFTFLICIPHLVNSIQVTEFYCYERLPLKYFPFI